MWETKRHRCKCFLSCPTRLLELVVGVQGGLSGRVQGEPCVFWVLAWERMFHLGGLEEGDGRVLSRLTLFRLVRMDMRSSLFSTMTSLLEAAFAVCFLLLAICVLGGWRRHALTLDFPGCWKIAGVGNAAVYGGRIGAVVANAAVVAVVANAAVVARRRKGYSCRRSYRGATESSWFSPPPASPSCTVGPP